MLKIRRPLGRLIFNMGIAIPGKTVFLIETAPRLFTHSTDFQTISWFCYPMSRRFHDSVTITIWPIFFHITISVWVCCLERSLHWLTLNNFCWADMPFECTKSALGALNYDFTCTRWVLYPDSKVRWVHSIMISPAQDEFFIQIAKTPWSTSIRHRSDTFASNQCLLTSAWVPLLSGLWHPFLCQIWTPTPLTHHS